MKLTVVWTILFYVALAVCLWPLYVQGVQVVNYIQAGLPAHTLMRIPPTPILVAAARAVVLVWAIVAGVMLFRKQQDGYAWLVVVLVLTPVLAGMVPA